MQQLTADIAAGQVDVVVVYKIDRLSRSLLDFSSLLGKFDAQGVSFVSVTQAFNTSQSMGRLTLNVLLSFAQFERELASERLRDKAAASRAIGLWNGGQRPFGYRVVKGRLTVDETEADIVRYVYRRFIQIKSARLVVKDLIGKGFKNKTGGEFTHTIVARMIRNRIYRGDLVHYGRPIPGTHEAILTESLFVNAREVITQVALKRRSVTKPFVPNPLKGLIFGPSGKLLGLNTHHNRYGQRFRYYIPSGRKRYGVGSNAKVRYRADAFDAAVLLAIEPYVPRNVDRAETSNADLLRRLVRRIDVGSDDLLISLKTGATIASARDVPCPDLEFAKRFRQIRSDKTSFGRKPRRRGRTAASRAPRKARPRRGLSESGVRPWRCVASQGRQRPPRPRRKLSAPRLRPMHP